MKPTILALLLVGLTPLISPVRADTTHHHHYRHHRSAPKNEVSKLDQDRHTDHTVRQVTPDPHKSPGKHADNLSKNVNHEVNRESKDFNKSVNKASKKINHALSGKK